MKRKKWVNKVIALLLAAIMIVPSSLGTVAYAQEPEVSSEQTQTIQNADEDMRNTHCIIIRRPIMRFMDYQTLQKII